jgi:CheY-like chemotaxis protein
MEKSILIVDDELNMRRILSAILEKEGYKIFTAENGKKALQCFKERPSNIVIADLRMPEMDGLELLRELNL